MWCKPNGNNRRSNVPNKNGAKTGAESCDPAIHTPKLLIPLWINGQTIANTIEAIKDHKITTNGTNRFPWKKDKASGSYLKLWYLL